MRDSIFDRCWKMKNPIINRYIPFQIGHVIDEREFRIAVYGYKATLLRLALIAPVLLIAGKMDLVKEMLVLITGLYSFVSPLDNNHCKTKMGYYLKTVTVVLIIMGSMAIVRECSSFDQENIQLVCTSTVTLAMQMCGERRLTVIFLAFLSNNDASSVRALFGILIHRRKLTTLDIEVDALRVVPGDNRSTRYKIPAFVYGSHLLELDPVNIETKGCSGRGTLWD